MTYAAVRRLVRRKTSLGRQRPSRIDGRTSATGKRGGRGAEPERRLFGRSRLTASVERVVGHRYSTDIAAIGDGAAPNVGFVVIPNGNWRPSADAQAV